MSELAVVDNPQGCFPISIPLAKVFAIYSVKKYKLQRFRCWLWPSLLNHLFVGLCGVGMSLGFDRCEIVNTPPCSGVLHVFRFCRSLNFPRGPNGRRFCRLPLSLQFVAKSSSSFFHSNVDPSVGSHAVRACCSIGVCLLTFFK